MSSRNYIATISMLGAGLILVMAYILLHSSIRPSDAMFYYDAAWNLQNGSYTPPSPNRPFHHYLRWPVIVPLSILIKIFGPSQALLSCYSLIVHLSIALLIYLIFCKLQFPREESMISSFAILVAPFTILFPGLGSEPVTTLFLLTSLYFVLPERKRSAIDSRKCLIAGFLAGLAISATLVSVFALSLPLAVLFIRASNGSNLKDLSISFLKASVWLVVGILSCLTLIMCIEWYAFGDPLLRVKSIFWWHLKGEARAFSDTLSLIFDPGDRKLFLFAYLFNICRQEAIWISGAILGLVLFLKDANPNLSRQGRILPLAILVCWLVYEFLSWPVIEKTYLRFVAAPILLLTALSLIGLYRLVSGTRTNLFKTLLAVLASALITFQIVLNFRALPDDPITHYFQIPIGIVYQHFKTEHPSLPVESLEIYTDRDQVPGFIHFGLLIPVYSDYLFRARHQRMDLLALPNTPGRIQYYIGRSQLSPELKRAGFQELEYEMPAAEQVDSFGLGFQHVYYRELRAQR